MFELTLGSNQPLAAMIVSLAKLAAIIAGMLEVQRGGQACLGVRA
jgi:hypothetical protein